MHIGKHISVFCHWNDVKICQTLFSTKECNKQTERNHNKREGMDKSFGSNPLSAGWLLW